MMLALGFSRRAFACALLLFATLMGLASVASAHEDHSVVEILEVKGVVDGPVAGYLRGSIEDANAGVHTSAIIIKLNSPGVLKADVSPVLEAISASRVPIVVWIPPGGEAIGGSYRIAAQAHILAVSAGARVGPAYPLDLADADNIAGDDEESPRVLVVPDTFDRANLPAGVAAEDRTVVTETQAVERGLAAFSAATLPDVLRELDGRVVTVDTLGRHTLQIDPVTADVRFENMGLGRRILHAVASPALAYVLLVGGAMALAFEIFQPGFGVAGLAGALLMGLGGYALTVLPVHPLAAIAVLGGLLLLAIDLSLAGFGLLTAAGALALTLGSVFLVDGPEALQLSPWLIGTVVISALIFFVVVMTVVLRAQAGQAQEGADQVVGKRAVVRSILNPEGHVFVDGALWRARVNEGAGKVKTGTVVRIVGLDDRLTLQVELEDSPATAE